MFLVSGIRSLAEVRALLRQTSISALPPEGTHKASPQTISGRTSYYPIRLEFLRYPQVIRKFCTIYRFGPPPPVTADSACSWIDHRVSGLTHTTEDKQCRAIIAYGSTLQVQRALSDSLSLRLRTEGP